MKKVIDRDIRYARRMSIFIQAFFVLIVSACDRASPHGGAAAPRRSKPALAPAPFTPTDPIERRDHERRLLQNAQSSFLMNVTEGFEAQAGCANVMAIAQSERCYHMLTRYLSKHETCVDPIAVFGFFGISGNGNAFVGVGALSIERAITRVIVFVQDNGGATIQLRYELEPEQKAVDFYPYSYLEGKSATMSELATLASQKSMPWPSVTFRCEGELLIPVSPALYVCARVEELSGRMSNYVPLSYVDFSGSSGTVKEQAD